MKRLSVIFLSSLLLIACSDVNKTADDGIYFQDFDNLKMWTHDPQVTGSKAHSGYYSTFTDSTHEYSQTFEMNVPGLQRTTLFFIFRIGDKQVTGKLLQLGQ